MRGWEQGAAASPATPEYWYWAVFRVSVSNFGFYMQDTLVYLRVSRPYRRTYEAAALPGAHVGVPLLSRLSCEWPVSCPAGGRGDRCHEGDTYHPLLPTLHKSAE